MINTILVSFFMITVGNEEKMVFFIFISTIYLYFCHHVVSTFDIDELITVYPWKTKSSGRVGWWLGRKTHGVGV